jgi:protein TonB
MRILFSLAFLLSVSLSFAQQAKDTSESQVFEKVEIEASVDANLWKRHLENELLPILEKASRRMKAGTYIVNVRFLVEKDGSISDVKALNDPGFGLAKGAEKVVKTGPRWSPGIYNGRKVRSYHTQPIAFVIAEG